MDMIEVRAISFIGKHGCYPEERQNGRSFEVDVMVWFDMQKAAETDRLTDTINYNLICEAVFAVGTQESFHLIERLAYEITAKILLLGRLERVKVVVRKYVPELIGGPSFVAAIVERTL
jgi:7,8-dihydroneopterin aldolase/epimerase/oxygenase